MNFLSISKNVFLLTTLSMAVSCNQRSESPVYRGAPTSKSDVGHIVQAPTEAVHGLATKHDVQIRLLNQDENLYEIFSLSRDTIEKELGTVPITKNLFFEVNDGVTADDKILKISDFVLDDSPLTECRVQAYPPEAIIEANGKPEVAEFKATPGETLNLSARFSRPGLMNYQSKIKVAWKILSPKGTLRENQEQFLLGQDQIFIPDINGLHRIYLLVQDDQANCGLSRLDLSVSSNPAYLGTTTNEPLNDDKLILDPFIQLDLTQAVSAWERLPAQGSGKVIAIVDTGVHYNHPELVNNIFVNAKEIPGNGLDDDQNGFVDDNIGWDFINSDAFPFDDQSHGTHVAGIASASEFGLAPHAKILPIKVLSASGYGDFGSIMAGLLYAVDQGASIINTSLGFSNAKLSDEDVAQIMAQFPTVFKKLEQEGVLLVAAAGNGDRQGKGMNNDMIVTLPASFPLKNIVAVAALDESLGLTTYSNFGKTKVHVAAPGGSKAKGIRSTFFENPCNIKLVEMRGTSMATPVVAGIAALTWSANPQLSSLQIKEILVKSGVDKESLHDLTVSGKAISALDAVERALSASQ